MKILVGCEESQTVTKELRKIGHEAYSCDLKECSGGHPEWHIKDDVFNVVKNYWDAFIGFPPCTDLALSGAKHFKQKREDGRQRKAIEFFMKLWYLDIEKICLENPMNIISGTYIKKWFPDLFEKYNLPLKPTQKIQPYYFGDEAQKTTWLWLKNLPLLYHNSEPNLFDSNVTHVNKGEFVTTPSGKKLPKWYSNNKNPEIRSKTFPGIAKAMAQQWNF